MERGKKSRILGVFRSRYHQGSRKVKIWVITVSETMTMPQR